MQKIIGTITTYHGDEHAYLRGYQVRVVAVLKGGARPDINVGSEVDPEYLTDDDAIRRAGGVTAEDRVEVVPWLEREGRFSFVASDPRAVDLDCFETLRDGTEQYSGDRAP